MTKDEIQSRVIKATSDILGMTTQDIGPDSNFSQDLDADSLDAVVLCMEFEKVFSISISDEDFYNLYTVEEVVDFIENKVNN